MRSMLLPMVSLLFHAWIAWRLVPDLGTPWSFMLLALVVLSASTAPLGLGMRRGWAAAHCCGRPAGSG